jgi:hypothetical protein
MAAMKSWPPQLTMDLALGVDALGDILERCALSESQYELLMLNPAFRGELLMLRKEVAEKGITFKRKAAVQAEMYLNQMDDLILDPNTAPSVKLEIFKTLSKLGGLEPKEEKGDATSVANIQININI